MHAPRSDWFEDVRAFYWLQSVLRLRQDLGIWIVRWDGDRGLQWTDLTEVDSLLQPFHFEIYYGKESLRDEHYLNVFRKLQESPQFLVQELLGFCDAFLPIGVDPERRAVVYVGQFTTRPLNFDDVAERWRALTGQEPAGANPDFARFARIAAGVPVIEEALLPALEELLRAVVDLLTHVGPDRGAIGARIDKLRREVFVKAWSKHDWIDQAVSAEKFRLTPWYHEGQLADWMREEMRINRLPTTVMALMPVDPPELQLDPVRASVRGRRIQDELIRYIDDHLQESSATRLQDYGVTVLTSPDPRRNATRASLELRERCAQLQAFVKQRFGVRSVVGVGRTMPEGEPLNSSYKEAVLALHLCVQLEQEVLFFDERSHQKDRPRYVDVVGAANELQDAFARTSLTELKVASDRYVKLLLAYSNERLDAVRAQFLSVVFLLLGTVQKRYLLRKDVADRLGGELSQRLEDAQSVYQAIEAFKDSLSRLSFFSSSSLGGPKTARLDATLLYLKENFAEPLKLTDVAKKSGFSVPAFSRVFKQATGTSFLAYVRGVRIEHAKKLLRTTSMSMEQIAQACGFQSQHHLIRSFKKVTNQTPGTYRSEKKRR